MTLRVDRLTRSFMYMQHICAPTDLYFGALLQLRGFAPSVDMLRALVSEHLDTPPVLTHRLASTHDGDLRWERDPHFDLRAHVGELADLAVRPEPAHMWLESDPGRQRPLWRMWLLPGDGDNWGLGYVVHHAAQDGTSMIRTLEQLFGDRKTATANAGQSDKRRSRPWRALRAVPILLATRKPAAGIATLPTFPGAGRHLTSRTVPLSDLRTISAASGATVGQAHLAALSGAIRRWSPLDFTGRSERDRRRVLPVCVPVDTREPAEGDVTTGNLIGLMPVGLPCGEPDPWRRLRRVMSRASRNRIVTGKSALRALTDDVPVRIAFACLARLGDRRTVALTASSFRSIAPLTVAGTPVDNVIAIPWLPPQHGCFSILTRYKNRATLSVLTAGGPDTSAALADHWVEAVSELREACRRVSNGT
ncbi:hypothetical protein AVL48_36425 [Amycolatopsis regifaucium]|uniref:diacylglycerol O-acyltransferase n=2 Tax=Amycolatopsis regifaucium TaxID=546365 RepID=A0A154MHY9_9PSEU|nr:wax ester/triacylglycerol synthase domain-containing protein [Amycolatopsis regifaucium]KZB83109.1 hypothetical protein AVL48_36425 [Amycolatopsis regifaucium]OKA03236.1 hypothetical protein ATP06_0237580 [Amycolatopsis regifaucium]